MGAYVLAVDVGTSRVAAATARVLPGGVVLAAPVPLGRTGDAAPSAIYLDDHTALFGDAAERRGLARPDRLLRGFRRRIGDDTPILAGSIAHRAEDLTAQLVDWVLSCVREREGSDPVAIDVTVPATWGPHRRALLTAALARRGLDGVGLPTEPEAVARHYESAAPLRPGRAVAVYDLGGGTFDLALLRRDAAGVLQTVGEPAGLDDVGGADIDDALLAHIVEAAGIEAAEPTADEAVAQAALRREVVAAKEALSFDTEAVVPVLLGRSPGTVRITRAELETLIEDDALRTIDVMAAAMADASLTARDLDAIVLAGGSSRIPRIAQMLSERFDCPIAVDNDPKAIVALGAARLSAQERLGEDAGLPATALPAAAEAAHTTSWLRRLLPRTAVGAAAVILAAGIVTVGAETLGSSSLPLASAVRDILPWRAADAAAIAAADADQPIESETGDTPGADGGAQSDDAAPAPRTSSPRPTGPRTATDTPASRRDDGTGSTTPAPSGSSPAGTAPSPSPNGSAPTTEPDPAPTTGPAPSPATDPDPTPTSPADPAPEPSTDPEPAPTTDPAPDPAPTTDPAPDPVPDPAPSDPPADPVPTPESVA